MSKEKLTLFKDNITKSEYKNRMEQLTSKIDEGEDALKLLLLGTITPELYSKYGSYKVGQHCRCAGLVNDSFTEKRLCKCMYYYNADYPKKCDKCDIDFRYKLEGDYKIVDYEVPAFYYGDHIGEIDLIIGDGETLYATEVKPYQGNNETLLRMVAEIMTYTIGYPAGKYKKAIAFFEHDLEKQITPQNKEYMQKDLDMQELLKKADITVFQFEKVNEDTYRLCRL